MLSSLTRTDPWDGRALTPRLHKRNFMLDTGECSNDEEYKVLAFEAKAVDDDVLVKLPPPAELDAMIGSSQCE